MSLMIKGMDMPTACNKCQFHNAYICTAKGSPVSLQIYLKDKKPFDCPLVEIPTPHGRLIDAEELVAYDGTEWETPDDVVMSGDIFGAHTIIEAEE